MARRGLARWGVVLTLLLAGSALVDAASMFAICVSHTLGQMKSHAQGASNSCLSSSLLDDDLGMRIHGPRLFPGQKVFSHPIFGRSPPPRTKLSLELEQNGEQAGLQLCGMGLFWTQMT